MRKKQNLFILILTVIVVLVLPLFVGKTIYSVNNKVTQACFDELQHATERLANELYRTTDMDHTILTAMASVIANTKVDNSRELSQIMQSYNSNASYQRIEMHDYYVSYGIAFGSGITGVEQITKEADEKMLANKEIYYMNHDRRSR